MTVTAKLQLVDVKVVTSALKGRELTPLPPSAMSSDLARLLNSGFDADVTLLCGSERVKAHSVILCARSSVFMVQLKGPLACSLEAVPVPEEITSETLRDTLRFIYTDKVDPSSAEHAQHLLNAADQYALPRLRAIAERKLETSLNVETAAFTLTLAEQHGSSALKDAALRFIAKNATGVLATEGWAHLKAASPALVDAVMLTLATGVLPPLIPCEEAAGAANQLSTAFALVRVALTRWFEEVLQSYLHRWQ